MVSGAPLRSGPGPAAARTGLIQARCALSEAEERVKATDAEYRKAEAAERQAVHEWGEAGVLSDEYAARHQAWADADRVRGEAGVARHAAEEARRLARENLQIAERIMAETARRDDLATAIAADVELRYNQWTHWMPEFRADVEQACRE